MKKVFNSFPLVLKVLTVAVLYFFIADASLHFSFKNSNATPVWPPSGFAFAILLLAGRGIAPGIFIGAFSVNLYAFLSNQTTTVFNASWVSTAIGLGNTAEALTGYYLMHTLAKVPTGEMFKKVNNVFRFIFTALLMCLPGCTIGATAIWLAGIISNAEYFTVWSTWWIGDASGILLVTPFLVIWSKITPGFIFRQKEEIAEIFFLLAIITITSGIVFLEWLNPAFIFTRAFILLPFLIWASVRLTHHVLTLLLIISAFIAAAGTITGMGPFTGPTLNESLLTVDTFIAFNSIMVLVLHAAILDREEKELSLQKTKDQLEELVQQRTQQLEEKNRELEFRNKELASFNYIASHDLQEPLRKIQTFSDRILTLHPSLPDDIKDLFRRIQVAAKRMKQFIENLLSYSKMDTSNNQIQLVDLNEVLQDVKNDLSEKIQETGAIIESKRLPQLKLIPFQMQQLVGNIIANAIKFRKEDAPPHIIIDGEFVDATTISDLNPDMSTQYFHLRISDKGIGFELVYAHKIFDIFQRLHAQSEYEGTGIGLAICKKIAETHNGFIRATGEPGIGATFHIYLPANNQPERKQL